MYLSNKYEMRDPRGDYFGIGEIRFTGNFHAAYISVAMRPPALASDMLERGWKFTPVVMLETDDARSAQVLQGLLLAQIRRDSELELSWEEYGVLLGIETFAVTLTRRFGIVEIAPVEFVMATTVVLYFNASLAIALRLLMQDEDGVSPRDWDSVYLVLKWLKHIDTVMQESQDRLRRREYKPGSSREAGERSALASRNSVGASWAKLETTGAIARGIAASAIPNFPNVYRNLDYRLGIDLGE